MRNDWKGRGRRALDDTAILRETGWWRERVQLWKKRESRPGLMLEAWEKMGKDVEGPVKKARS